MGIGSRIFILDNIYNHMNLKDFNVCLQLKKTLSHVRDKQ